MIHCPIWSYYPDKHDFEYIADVPWPVTQDQQTDWIQGMTEVEAWLYRYSGSKHQYWAWHKAQETYHIGVAFKLATHRTMFLLTYA